MPTGKPAVPGIFGTPIGGQAATPDTFTIGDLMLEIQHQGGQLSRVIVAADHGGYKAGQPVIDPNYVLQPGDQVEAINDGKTFLAAVNPGGQDVSDWTPTKVPTSTARNASASDYPPASQLGPNASQAAQQLYDHIMADPNSTPQDRLSAATQLTAADKAGATAGGKDADSVALANMVRQRLAANPNATLSTAELVALGKQNNAVANGSTNPYSMPVAGYSGPLNPHWAGNENGAVDLPVPVGTPVRAMTSGTLEYVDPHYGTAGATVVLRGNDGHIYMYQDLDPNSMPKQGQQVTAGDVISRVGESDAQPGVQSTGPHVHVAIASPTSDNNVLSPFETKAGTSVNFDTLSFMKKLAADPTAQAGNVTNMQNPFGAPKPHLETIGGRVYSFDPTTNQPSLVLDTTGLQAPAHFVVQSGGHSIVMHYDPTTKQLTQDLVGDLSPTEQGAQQLNTYGKVGQLFQQAAATQEYIKQQLASGAWGTGPDAVAKAQQYTNALDTYLQTGLQGTTPWDVYKQQQTDNAAKQTLAAQLMEKQLEQTNTMATTMTDNVMNALVQSKARNIAPGTLSGIYSGALAQGAANAKPLSDMAQNLLSSLGQKAQAAGLNPIPGMPTPAGVGGAAGANGPDQAAPTDPTAPDPSTLDPRALLAQLNPSGATLPGM